MKKALSEKIAGLPRGDLNRMPLSRRAESVISGRQEGRVKDHELFPVTSVYILDFWWKVLEERSRDLSCITGEAIPGGAEGFDEIFRRTVDFSVGALDEVDFGLRAERALNPDRQIFGVVDRAEAKTVGEAKIFGKPFSGSSVKHKIRENMTIGISHDLALIEVVEKVFQRQFGHEIWQEEYARIISSREFENVLASIGVSGRVQAIPFVSTLESERRGIGEFSRSVYNPDFFHFEQGNDDVRNLQINEHKWLSIESAVLDMIELMTKSKVQHVDSGLVNIGGCPLHAVRTSEGSNAFRGYSRLVLEVVKALYLTKFEKREELPSSGQVFHMGPSSI